LALVENNDIRRLAKKAYRAGYRPAILISVMIVVLGFYATIPAQAVGPPTVNLGTAGNYVILSETGISSTGTTSIVGDIGVSPYAATSISGNFALTLDASGQFSTSPLVTGHVYAADYASPTPSNLGTAIADMMTAYNDSALRTSPDHTNLYAGDLTGQTLTPGLYNYTTGVIVSAGGVTISGAASDIWIFQVALDLGLADGAHVTLSGGAVTSNIFWQVAGQVTLGTGAVMMGIILCKTAIVMNTGAALEGRALAQTAVTLDASTVVTPGTPIPEFSQVLIPLIGTVLVVAIVSRVRNQRK